MILITAQQKLRMLAYGALTMKGLEIDHQPVVKLFFPVGAATWLLTEMDPRQPDIMFGLCDLGLGFPELGYVSLKELESIVGPFGLKIERDLHFTAHYPLSVYAEAARQLGCITEQDNLLKIAEKSLRNER